MTTGEPAETFAEIAVVNRSIVGLENFRWSLVDTAWGVVVVAGDDLGLNFAGYPCPNEDSAIGELMAVVGRLGTRDDGLSRDYARPIAAYFDGQPLNWSEIPVHLVGTAFQQQVWRTTREIPYGEAWTYRDVARACGQPLSARPVGTALAANRAGLLVPCHRVVASGGIGGYGGWRERKVALLRLEGTRPGKADAGDSGPETPGETGVGD